MPQTYERSSCVAGIGTGPQAVILCCMAVRSRRCEWCTSMAFALGYPMATQHSPPDSPGRAHHNGLAIRCPSHPHKESEAASNIRAKSGGLHAQCCGAEI